MSTAADIVKRLPEEWQKKLIGFYSQGMSDAEVRREMKISPGAWAILYADTVESEFQEIVEYGRDLSKAWWESLGRKSIADKSINTPLFIATMQNRFDWSKEKRGEGDPAVEMSIEDIDARLDRLREKLGQ